MNIMLCICKTCWYILYMKEKGHHFVYLLYITCHEWTLIPSYLYRIYRISTALVCYILFWMIEECVRYTSWYTSCFVLFFLLRNKSNTWKQIAFRTYLREKQNFSFLFFVCLPCLTYAWLACAIGTTYNNLQLLRNDFTL